jgi:hypothetical protein
MGARKIEAASSLAGYYPLPIERIPDGIGATRSRQKNTVEIRIER